MAVIGYQIIGSARPSCLQDRIILCVHRYFRRQGLPHHCRSANNSLLCARRQAARKGKFVSQYIRDFVNQIIARVDPPLSSFRGPDHPPSAAAEDGFRNIDVAVARIPSLAISPALNHLVNRLLVNTLSTGSRPRAARISNPICFSAGGQSSLKRESLLVAKGFDVAENGPNRCFAHCPLALLSSYFTHR